MGRKKVLEKRKARLEAKKSELLKRSRESEDISEVRAINDQLMTISEDLQDIADELAAIAEEEGTGNGEGSGDGEGAGEGEGSGEGEGRSGVPTGADLRNAQIVGAYRQNPQVQQSEGTILDSMQYRQAFATFVRTGEWTYRGADEGMLTTGDIGKVIPNTIMQEFIKNLKVYGNLYNKVRKLNVQGGVEFPIEELVPVVRWISETVSSPTQSAPETKTSISFGYYICEAKIAQSLLSSVTSLPILESEIARLLAEAFIKEFDNIIINGDGKGKPTGILNDARVKESNKITFSEADLENWVNWRKKLFAKIPLAYRGQGILVMTANTWETYIMTLRDSANRPLYTETYNPDTGNTECRFAGREVVLVEPDIIKDFDIANEGEAFAVYFKPTDYAINSNLQVGFKRYYDEDNNKWINKGLCIVDGKLLDTNGVYILKKAAAQSTPTTEPSAEQEAAG